MLHRARALLVVLAFVTVAFAGCIAQSDLNAAEQVDEPVAPTSTGTSAVVYRPSAHADEGNEDDVPLVGHLIVLPDAEGIPLPVGTTRYSPLPSFEPTLGVTSDGSIFLGTFHARLPDWALLQRSQDDGLTWHDVTPRVAGVSVPPQSNDPYVYVDPDTDRIFLSDLQALACSTLSFSDDLGETWTTTPIGCGLPLGGHDHQTVFTATPRHVPTVGYPKVVYYCVNRVADSACASSLDGGVSFGALRPLVYNGLELCRTPSLTDPLTIAGGLHAHGAAAPDGTIYLPKGHCGKPTVAISQDDGLTWQSVVISETVPVRGHEVAMASDESGNVYAFWIGIDRLPYLAASGDGGWTWNAPVMVAPHDVGTTDFPTIAAGGEGRVAVAYYGTQASKEYREMTDDDTWNAYITLFTDALEARPVVATVTVNDADKPLAQGICGGGRCGGVGDFIDIVIDHEGRPWAALVDVCHPTCDEGGVYGLVGTLAEGPRLRGPMEALRALILPQ